MLSRLLARCFGLAALLLVAAAAPAAAQTTTLSGPVTCNPPVLPTGTCTVSNWGSSPSQATAVVNNNTAQNANATINGNVSSGNFNFGGAASYAIGYFGYGVQNAYFDTNPEPYDVGPIINLNLNSSANIIQTNLLATQGTSFPSPGGNDPTTEGGSNLGGALTARSIGGAGMWNQGPYNYSGSSNQPPYVGGAGGPVTVSMSSYSSITAYGTGLGTPTAGGIPWLFAGIGAYSIGGPGGWYFTHNNCCVGDGGAGGVVTVTTPFGSTINVSSYVADVPAVGIEAFSLGGLGTGLTFNAGGLGAIVSNGGAGGAVNVTVGGSIYTGGGTYTGGIGILAGSLGAPAPVAYPAAGPVAGAPGNGGAVNVTLQSGGYLNQLGTNVVGIMATSQAGPTTIAPNFVTNYGQAGNVTVNLDTGSTVRALGNGFSVGVLALSGGVNALTDIFGSYVVANSGAGYSGDVTVTNQGAIITSGQTAAGIAALSIGGAPSVTTAIGASTLGNTSYWSSYGAVGSANVVNTGSITTQGTSAFGIVALSGGGGGGLLNSLSSNSTVRVGGADGGSGQGGNNGGTVSVTNTGSIATGNANGGGNAAIGIVAQSIGGGGGSASGAYIIGGASGNSGGNGGAVNVFSGGGMLTTMNDDAVGVLAQSIGGGGGNGGDAVGIIAGVGGDGGDGGAGAAVTVEIGSNTSGGSYSVKTSGDFAYGVIAQSIGGGGGNGGASKSYGAFFSMAVGGGGGVGGDGGNVLVGVDPGGVILTTGESAHGVMAQSIGGGGGNGGAANAYSAGAFFSAGIALGGSGGAGGNSGQVAVSNQGSIITGSASAAPPPPGCTPPYALSSQCALTIVAANASGFDSIGILAQSIGGGGGNGGSATAKSLAVGVPGFPEIPTISADFTLGGSGGAAGNANTVTVGNAYQIITYGNGSHGVVAQSIGGGGGNGGDSSATAASIEGEGLSANLSVAIGGSGGAAGNGGVVQVTNGGTASLGSITDCTSGCKGVIQTWGNYAAGIVAQSVGGGGGNGGLGDASANSPNLGGALNGEDTGKSLNLSIGVGGSGGSGSSGGAVAVYNDLGSSIITVGSGAQGILAQSIGGGGGSGGGGGTTGGGNTVNLDVKVGGGGGSGNNGSTVTVSNAGAISTKGGDGVGILAQSIGGGGGNGGSTDNAASIDWMGVIENLINPPTGKKYTGAVAVGGSGGASGDGGAVNVTNTGSIATQGERAYGVMAQSIGGGGGSGGSASTDSSGTFTFAVAVGGSGSGGGGGGNVTVTNSGTISTSGFNAVGIVAQSIGGGGGVGGDGSTGSGLNISSMGVLPTITVGAQYSGSGGGGGNALDVTVDSTGGSIRTAGDAAYGILAQSIGGGGGVGGSGGTTPGSSSSIPSVPALVVLNLGGGAGASGTGALVNVTGNTIVTAGNDAYGVLAQSIGGGGGVGSLASGLTGVVPGQGLSYNVGGVAGDNSMANTVTVNQNGALVTSGARSFGIVAQSIGGGGGIATNAGANISSTQLQWNAGQNYGAGAAVNVNLGSSGSITTSGAGAWGILAQSIGGGGGFIGDPSLNLIGPVSNTLPYISGSNPANAGTVTVNLYGNIVTTGANAHGVFAQSIGGGGGVAAGCNACAQAVAVSGNSQQIYNNLPTPTYSGAGNNVFINQYSGMIAATGVGSIGIVAQSSGNQTGTNGMYLSLSGSVIGGTNTGYTGAGVGAAGILLSGGGAVSGNNNIITVNSGGSVSTIDGISGTAITTSYGLTDVYNSGVITGDILLGSNPGAITNNQGGVLNTGPTIVASSLTNSGTLNVGGAQAVGTTSLTGNYTQTSGGVLGVIINSLASQQASLLNVSGSAQVGGQVQPSALNLLPGTYKAIAANSLSSTATGSTGLFNWTVSTTANSLSITPSANLASPAGVSLTPSQASLAQTLQTAWTTANPAFARDFAKLSGVSAAQYPGILNSLSAASTQAHASALSASSGTMLSAPLSCPVFTEASTIINEDSCAWGRVSGARSKQSNVADASGYTSNNMTTRFGGQRAIAPGWFLGGAFGFGQNWTKMDGGSTGGGHIFEGSAALKYSDGPWLVSGSATLGGGAHTTNRTINLPWVSTVLSSNQNVFLAGGRLRTAYEFAFGNFYTRPYLDLDLVHVGTGHFRESGPADLALDVQASNHTGVVIWPMVEFGLRQDFGNGFILRPYVAGGFSYEPDPTRKVSSSFIGSMPWDGTFTSYIRNPYFQGSLEAGLQLYQAHGFEVRAGYSARDGYQTGFAKFAYHF